MKTRYIVIVYAILCASSCYDFSLHRKDVDASEGYAGEAITGNGTDGGDGGSVTADGEVGYKGDGGSIAADGGVGYKNAGAGTCVDQTGCCATGTCPEGKSCVDNVCICNRGTKSCDSSCIPEGSCCDDGECPATASCNNGTCRCPANTHQCGDSCASDTSAATCGTSCNTCEAPIGGSASCDGAQCKPTCPNGQKPCAGVCIAETAACTGQCPSGTHDCSGVCLANDSVNGCGTSSCIACAVPTNGQATCDGTKCDFTCLGTNKKCGSVCIADGACCTNDDCKQNAGCSASYVCQCASTFKACGNECIANTACCNGCPANSSCSSGACVCDSGYFGTACNYFFQGLGFPNFTDTSAQANALSADGSSVVGWSLTSNVPRVAFRWRNGTNQSLGTLSTNLNTEAFGVSGDGSIVVGDALVPSDGSSTTVVGFSWTSNKMSSLGVVEYGTYSHALGISANGNVIVGYGDSDGEQRGLRWMKDGSGAFTIGQFSNHIDALVLRNINANGAIAVGHTGNDTQNPEIPFNYPVSAGDYSPLNLLASYSSGSAIAISSDGNQTAGYVRKSSTDRAVKWSGATATDLGTLAASSQALAMNGDGSVIVGSSNGQAMIWTEAKGMRALSTVLTQAGLNLSGWTLGDAIGVSSDGKVIAGNGVHGTRTEPWIARLP